MVEQSVLCKIIKSRFSAITILTAQNGEEAFDIFQNNEIDIILSDWEMPVMSGEELIYNVRNNSNNKKVPFVMVTAHSGKDFIVTAIQNGVNHYIVKPFTPSDIERKVRECLKFSRRSSLRYSNLPSNSSCVTIDKAKIPSAIIDVSRSGLMLDLGYQDEVMLFKRCSVAIEVELPTESRCLAIGPIVSTILRLEALDFSNANAKRCRMGLHFWPEQYDKTVYGRIETLINWLHANLPDGECCMLNN